MPALFCCLSTCMHACVERKFPMYLWLDTSGQWLLFAVIASLCVLQETFAGLCQRPSVSKISHSRHL